MVSAEVRQPPASMDGLGLGLIGAVLLGVGGENGMGLLMLLGGPLAVVGVTVAEVLGVPTGAPEPACDFWVQPASSNTAAPAAASLISTMGVHTFS